MSGGRIRALALTLALSSGGCQPSDTLPAVESGRAEEAVRLLMAAWEQADTALILDLFWPEATYDDFPNQVTYQGPTEIVGYVTGVHSWGDDIYMSPGRIHAMGDVAVAEWVFSAVQARPMGDVIPQSTGLEVVTNGVTIVELRDDRIIRAADYADTAPLVLQLGGRIEMPGGQVIELGSSGN